MRRSNGFTLVELLVVVGIIGMLASMLVPTIRVALAIAEANVCLGQLKGVGTALQLYRQQNDQRWPWIANVRSDWSKVPTGASRDQPLPQDNTDPGERSITALMFLLVREGQPAKLFVCPSDSDAVEDTQVRRDHDGDPETPMEYYGDFAGSRNVSYSYQAPVRRGDEGFVNGVADDDAAGVIVAEKTPAAGDPAWRPDALAADTPIETVRANLSPNHRGIGVINVLRVGLDVTQPRRPDVGTDLDNIYTASGRRQTGARDGVSLSVLQHLSARDGFLIGPVADANQP
ncbi:MAG TPA: type II secretion system protein [Phycisphaerae bacterium]|nr:type II secretion system protein [Phycisphaerae bacterium]